MDNLQNCHFMRVLLHGTQRDYDLNKLQDYFLEFKHLLSEITDGDMHYRDKYRQLKSAYDVIELRIEKSPYERGTYLTSYASIAIRTMRVELDILEKQIQFPSLFPSVKIAKDKPLIYWNQKKFSKTALMSLITAIDILGACEDSGGNQSPS